jgi:TRAP transporter TAXI family solute receptor
MKKYFLLLSIVLAGIFIVNPCAAQQIVAFASLPQGTANFFQASALAKVFQQKTGIRARVNPLRGATLGVAAVSANEAEFMMGAMTDMSDMYNGRGDFEGKNYKNLRLVFNNRPLTIGMLVRKNSDIKTFHDLKGKRLPTGWKAFPSQNNYQIAMLKTVGLTVDDIVPVPVPDLIRAASDFMEGKSDATAIATVAPKVVEINNAVGGIRFLSLPEGPEALKALHSVHPDYLIVTVQPSKRQVGVEVPTRILAVDITVVTNSDVADDIVYALVKTAYENKADLVKAHGSFMSFFPKNMVKRSFSVPYHPGAVKFYKEVGLWTDNK